MGRIGKMIRVYSDKNGAAPNLEQISAETGMSESKVEQILSSEKHVVSLDSPQGEDNDTPLMDLLKDKNTPGPEELVSKKLINSQIDKALCKLSPQEQNVLINRFGLQDGTPKKLQEIANMLNLSRERVRQLELRAKRKLRCNVELAAMNGSFD
jgi:RNA polymerase primary sigma factor